MSAKTETPQLREEHFDVVQEEDRVASRSVTLVFVGVIVIAIVSVWVQSLMLQSKKADLGPRHPVAAEVAPRQIDGIHQTSFEEDRHGLELREQQRKAIDGWSWIDRDHGLARIPVERAMELIVANPSLLQAPAASASASAASSASVTPAGEPTP